MATTTVRVPRARRDWAARNRSNGEARRKQVRLSPSERAASGKAARNEAPRSSHGEWEPASGRPDPVALLEEQAGTRVPQLVPIRYGRMVDSPFAFFRGAAYVMASDLAATPKSGIRVQLCGDAHLSNFGGFASPERELVFDLNDFDETLPGPWEWDVKRLAASLSVAGRDRGFGRKRRREIVAGGVGEYRRAMRCFAGSKTLDIWYARFGGKSELADELRSQVKRRQVKQFDRTVAKARRKDSERAFAKLTEQVNGTARIAPDPPLIVRLEDLAEGIEPRELEDGIRSLIASYAASLPGERRKLLARYHYTDAAHKVVGVGSVGTRAWVILMLGRDSGDPLFLQAKEAQRSVLEPFAGKSEYANQGQRVVEGQRLMQATSDIFLGWLRTTGLDGRRRDFYVRQLWDWKTSPDITTMVPSGMAVYARMCGWTLARAHACSGDPIAIGAYLGSSDTFDRALADFAEAYADQNELDHRELVSAIESGRVPCETGF